MLWSVAAETPAEPTFAAFHQQPVLRPRLAVGQCRRFEFGDQAAVWTRLATRVRVRVDQSPIVDGDQFRVDYLQFVIHLHEAGALRVRTADANDTVVELRLHVLRQTRKTDGLATARTCVQPGRFQTNQTLRALPVQFSWSG